MLADRMHGTRMQCLEGIAALEQGFRLARNVGVVSSIGEERGSMRIAGAAVDAAIVDEKIAGRVFRKNGDVLI